MIFLYSAAVSLSGGTGSEKLTAVPPSVLRALMLPPCAFSYAFNCPLPPKQNRFPFAIEAGEKLPLTKDGSPLH